MRRNVLPVLVALAGLLAPPAVRAGMLEARVDAIARQALEDGPIAGLSIAVARGEEVLIGRGYGVADVERRIPAGVHTLYPIASITKLITAAGVVKLAESGEVELDGDLGSLLPGALDPEQARRITLRHLLSHTSGLVDYESADTERWLREGTPLDAAFVLGFLEGKPLEFEPGSSWAYSNSGYYLAGLILERIGGRDYGTLIRERVAGPLGLDDTALCDDVRATRGYEPAADGFRRSRIYEAPSIRADGGLCSTVLDLVALPRSLARSGWLSERSLKLMLGPTRLGNGTLIDYGLGVRRGSLEGRSLWGHTGGMVTYWSTVAYYPEEDVTIAVLVNTDGADSDALVVEGLVARAVFGLADARLADRKLPRAVAKQLGGTYGVGSDVIEVVSHGKRIELRTSGQAPGLRPLLLQRDGSFGYEAYPMDRVIFHKLRGAPVGLSEYHNGIFATYRPRRYRGLPVDFRREVD